MLKMLRLIGLFVLVPAAAAVRAGVDFAPIFNDGAVLQCGMEVNVWGDADPGAGVEVRLDDEVVASGTADADGHWRVTIPQQAPGGGHRLIARTGNGSAEVRDVWFGEVWLATGQSNMVVPLSGSHGGKEWLQKTLPDIRFVKVPNRVGLPVQEDFTPEDLAWETFRPGVNHQIAAVAFYFAEKLRTSTDRRIGIIQSSWGGTPAESWTPLDTLDRHPELEHYADMVRDSMISGRTPEEFREDQDEFERRFAEFRTWVREGRKGSGPGNPGPWPKDNPWSPKCPTVLYENMIVPLVPYTARGVIWYQGESNAGDPQEYRVLFPAMIRSWRRAWDRPDWPFFFVQLAAFGHPTLDWPGLRAAQTYTRDTLDHTGMALAIDCGEEKDIHPKAKRPVGERLALLALDQVYGRDVVSRGPSPEHVNADGAAVRVEFEYVAQGLESSDGAARIPGFEMAGPDGVFHAARARIVDEDTVELRCDAVAEPDAVRYAWHNWVEPPVTLQNSAGLPAEPFRADDL
ncbi:sialate O-acetylesterase [Kiritimatiella glycovorans]|uniref:Sialate O-acetylesterase domain-containing protein n=1 Tax=Kiritimatiella glycovorans TaxID=1307763 RepID=A0A0G3EKB4_9BACT|nr:sialate O-acetylesterase [Kiritimatiella glycovorans]AKJ64614.1 hypothetical protein L21SP4_01366 [Kiritimatiella glycovorans]